MKRTLWSIILCLLAAAWVPRAQSAEPTSALTIQLPPYGTGVHPPVITAIAADPRGECLAVAGDDHVIRILRRSDLEVVETLALHEGWVRSLDFSPDGRYLASAGHDGRLVLWDRSEDWRPVQQADDVPALACARFSPDGTTVGAVGFAPQLHLLRVGSDLHPRLICECRDLRSVAFRADSLLVATAGRSGEVHFFDAETGASMGDVQLHRGRVREMWFVADTATVVSVGEDGRMIVYDSDAGRVVHDIAVPRAKLHTACLVDPRHVAVGGSDNVIRIFNIESGERILDLRGHSGSVATLASVEGDLYSGGFDTTVRMWRVQKLVGSQRIAEAEADAQPEARTSRLP